MKKNDEGHVKPLRMCCICRQRMPKAAMRRHTLDANGALSPDLKQIRPGRGWYCCASSVCLEKFAAYRPGKGRKASGKLPGSQGEI